jgi:hypothetical protein
MAHQVPSRAVSASTVGTRLPVKLLGHSTADYLRILISAKSAKRASIQCLQSLFGAAVRRLRIARLKRRDGRTSYERRMIVSDYHSVCSQPSTMTKPMPIRHQHNRMSTDNGG